MKEPAYKGKEPLPLSVYVSARAGDPQAVERLLRYYDNYMNCLCTRTLYARTAILICAWTST